MPKLKDKDMQNQHSVNGEFRVSNDPDGVKRQAQRRGNAMWRHIPTLFIAGAVILAVVVMVTTK